jgi:hypothetical protein
MRTTPTRSLTPRILLAFQGIVIIEPVHFDEIIYGFISFRDDVLELTTTTMIESAVWSEE